MMSEVLQSASSLLAGTGLVGVLIALVVLLVVVRLVIRLAGTAAKVLVVLAGLGLVTMTGVWGAVTGLFG